MKKIIQVISFFILGLVICLTFALRTNDIIVQCPYPDAEVILSDFLTNEVYCTIYDYGEGIWISDNLGHSIDFYGVDYECIAPEYIGLTHEICVVASRDGFRLIHHN